MKKKTPLNTLSQQLHERGFLFYLTYWINIKYITYGRRVITVLIHT